MHNERKKWFSNHTCLAPQWQATTHTSAKTIQYRKYYLNLHLHWCTMLFLQNIRSQTSTMWQNGTVATHAEASKQMDDKLKVNLMDNYHKLMTDRCTKWLQCLKGTVRQRYTDGQIEQVDAIWDMCMECNGTEDSNDNCSTSSDEWWCGKVQCLTDQHSEQPGVEPDPAPNWYKEITTKLDQAYGQHTLAPTTVQIPPMLESPLQLCTSNITQPTIQPTLTDDNSLIHGKLHSNGNTTEKAAMRIFHKALTAMKTPLHPIRVHIDRGANRSITNDITLLTNYRNIKRYPMNGVSDNGPIIYCTSKGLFPWKTDTGEVILVNCIYRSATAETVISPTDIVVNHISNFTGVIPTQVKAALIFIVEMEHHHYNTH
jgi:hypothetical protein